MAEITEEQLQRGMRALGASMVTCTRPTRSLIGVCTTHPDCRQRAAQRVMETVIVREQRGEPVPPKSRRRVCGCAS